MATVDGFTLPCDVIPGGVCPDEANRVEMAVSGVDHELGVRFCEAAVQILAQRGLSKCMRPDVCPRITLDAVDGKIEVQHA